ncbi:MAG: ABC transporter permease [Chloroflexia bacterium]|nr:ABC transporter permease [Chloroflexia bacterium]
MHSRMWPIMRKEFLHIWRDHRTLAMILLQPVIQLLLFGYALSSDVKHTPMAVWDQDNTPASRALLQRFRQSQYFDPDFYVDDYAGIEELVDSGQVKVAMVIPPDYAAELQQGHSVPVQFFVDGSDPTIATRALSYGTIIAQSESTRLVLQRLGGRAEIGGLDFRPRVWFNPAMDDILFNVPGLVAIVLQWLSISMAAFAIVGERERGTLEQLIVTPIKPYELVLGKTATYVAVAFADVGIALLVAVGWFGMPIRGSLLLLVGLSLIFLTFSLSIGLFLSTISKTMYQAQQTTIFIMFPMILLSGFLYPIETMPPTIQFITRFIPLTYYLRIIRSIVLKGVGLQYVWKDALILAGFGLLFTFISALRFRKTIE